MNNMYHVSYTNNLDVKGQKISLFMYITNNSVFLEISWTRIADALKDIHGDLALSIREKYCSTTHGEIIRVLLFVTFLTLHHSILHQSILQSSILHHSLYPGKP